MKAYWFGLLIILVVALAGCGDDGYWDHKKVLTNAEIASAHEYCHAHGMLFWQWSNSHYETVEVQCYIGNRTDDGVSFEDVHGKMQPKKVGP